MKPYALYEPYADGVGKVTGLLYGNLPEGTEGGMYVTEFDEKQSFSGLEEIVLIEIETGKVYYSYIKPVTVDSRLEALEAENVLLKEENESLNATVDSILTEVIPSLMG